MSCQPPGERICAFRSSTPSRRQGCLAFLVRFLFAASSVWRHVPAGQTAGTNSATSLRDANPHQSPETRCLGNLTIATRDAGLHRPPFWNSMTVASPCLTRLTHQESMIKAQPSTRSRAVLPCKSISYPHFRANRPACLPSTGYRGGSTIRAITLCHGATKSCPGPAHARVGPEQRQCIAAGPGIRANHRRMRERRLDHGACVSQSSVVGSQSRTHRYP